MFRARIIWIIIGGLLLAVALVVVLQMLDVLSRLDGHEGQGPTPVIAETADPLGLAPTLFHDVSEYMEKGDKKLRLSGTAQPNTVVIISNRGKRIRQIKSDENGNWMVTIDAIDEKPMVLEAVLFTEAGVTVRGDETIYRIVLPKRPKKKAKTGQADETKEGETKEGETKEGETEEAPLPVKTSDKKRPTLIMVSVPGGPTRLVRSPFGGSPTEGPLTMGPIDYDDAGGVIFSGTTSEEGRVRLYAGEAAIGETRVGAGGRWNFIAGRMLPMGEYDVRAELIRPDAERVQVTVPFERLPPVEMEQANIPKVTFEPFRWQVRRALLGGGAQNTVIFAPQEADPIIAPEQ